MAKEFEVLDVGYLGSFIEERADNDGADIKKSISLGVPDNNIWVINPITGLLESQVSMGDKNDPQFVQFNGTKPTAPSTDLVIKTIGKTLKIVNSTNTELCVSESYKTVDFTYNPSSFPTQYSNCEKSIFFTSNNKIQWPTHLQTFNMLEDLSKKIPYDIGFSKKYYKIGKLPHHHLMKIQEDTNISADFLKRFDVLFLFDSEYGDNIEYSKIKLGFEWDGFSVDSNDANNLVYSDYFKNEGAVYSNFVFLVSDYTLSEIQKYFSNENILKRTKFQTSVLYDPRTEIKKPTPKESYKRTISFITEPNARPTIEDVLGTITTKKLYEIYGSSTDINLIKDIIVSEIFTEVQDIFNIKSILDGRPNGDSQNPETNLATDLTDTLDSEFSTAFNQYSGSNPSSIDYVNSSVYGLLNGYYLFQRDNNYPGLTEIIVNTASYGTIDLSSPFKLLFAPPPITATTVVNTNPPDQPENPNNIFTFTDTGLDHFTYKRFDYNNDFTLSETFYKTKPLFSNGIDRNSVFYLEYPNEVQSKYYLNVKSDTNLSVNTQTIFSIAYAHISGSGSSYIVNELGYGIDQYPSKGIYKKYMAECFAGVDSITFKNNKKSDHFYVLQFNRDFFKDRLNNGNIQITLAPLSSSNNQFINTGSNFEFDQNSNQIFTLVDDSLLSKTYFGKIDSTDEYYNLVQGTIQDGPIDYDTAVGWGLVFPNKGLILLDADTLDQYCNFNTVTASIDGDNIRKLFLSISGSCSPNDVREDHGYWYLRSSEVFCDENYFCRIGRNEFNYSNNYTYTSGSTMKVFMDKVNNTTKTYVTSVGIYDDSNNLLAVGKFKKPLIKDSSLEYVINVKFRRI